MERLTIKSEISGLPILKALYNSNNEDSCQYTCELHGENGCAGCPIQESMTKLSGYEDTKLQPKQVEKLKGKYKELQKENRKLKKEMLKMLKYAWYNQEDEDEQE